MAFPTYTSTDSTLRLTVVEHPDGVAAVYSFPYVPVSQDEAWIFDDLYQSYAYAQLPTSWALVTAPSLTTRGGTLERS